MITFEEIILKIKSIEDQIPKSTELSKKSFVDISVDFENVSIKLNDIKNILSDMSIDDTIKNGKLYEIDMIPIDTRRIAFKYWEERGLSV